MRSDPLKRDAASIAVATGIYAVSFGVLSVAAGFSVAQTCAMSLLTFTGASQFTFVSVIASGGPVVAGLPPALLLAARNGIYAVSLRDVLRGGPLRRAVDAHLVIDESTAMAHAQDERSEKRRAFLLTGVGILLCWNAGTLAGTPAGANGSSASAMAAPSSAAPAARRERIWGTSRARKTAGKIASRPSVPGSAIAPPASAPASVPAFQHSRIPTPVSRNARRLSERSC